MHVLFFPSGYSSVLPLWWSLVGSRGEENALPELQTHQTKSERFLFILLYLLAEQSSLVCKCELSDRCE